MIILGVTPNRHCSEVNFDGFLMYVVAYHANTVDSIINDTLYFCISNSWIGRCCRHRHIASIPHQLHRYTVGVGSAPDQSGLTAMCHSDMCRCVTIVDRFVSSSVDTVTAPTLVTCMECRRAVTISVPRAGHWRYEQVLLHIRCAPTTCTRLQDLRPAHIPEVTMAVVLGTVVCVAETRS